MRTLGSSPQQLWARQRLLCPGLGGSLSSSGQTDGITVDGKVGSGLSSYPLPSHGRTRLILSLIHKAAQSEEISGLPGGGK